MSALPRTMKAIGVSRPGGPESLFVADVPLPEPLATQVSIRVAAAGLNRADILQRRGLYPPPPGAPTTLGLEVAGVVAAVGDEVSEFRVGDRVCALLQGGGYSQHCVIDAAQVMPIPGALMMTEAASLPEALFTVWSNVFDCGALKRGESLLVHGGSSGVGVMAIQLAAAMGSRVFATAGSEEKCRFCEQLGAMRAIDYKREDFVSEMRAQTQGRGVDVILDMVAGNYAARNIQLMATGGRLVMIAVQGGVKGEIDFLQVIQRRLVLTGSALRTQSIAFKRRIKLELLQHVWPLFESGAVKPIVDRVFALDDAAAAHQYMESGVHKGKIVLTLE